jgi:FtsH-binding integral membrane protein
MSQNTPRPPMRPASRFSPRPPGAGGATGGSGQVVALRSEETRATFITRTYMHLFGAILAFTLLEMAYFMSGLALPMAQAMLSRSWLLVLGGFVVVSWLASRVAHVAESPAAQYAALGGYVIAESIIFVPLLLIAQVAAPGVIQSAAVVTLFGFTGLTVLVFTTRKDFSFLGAILGWGGVVALMLIVSGALFGFELGTFFSVGMVALAGGAILHDTSKVLHDFPEDRYIAASLELFASVALMFWYVLRLYLSRED